MLACESWYSFNNPWPVIILRNYYPLTKYYLALSVSSFLNNKNPNYMFINGCSGIICIALS